MSILRDLGVRLGLSLDGASFAEGATAVEGIKAGLEAIVKAAEEVAEAFIENIKATAEYGDEVIELAAATGVGTASLQHLAAAAVEDGISLQELSHSLILLTRQMGSAKDGSEETAKAFQKLGVRVTDSAGRLRPTEDVLIDISEKFHNMKDGAEKTAAALHLFGRSGAGLIDFLNKGKEAFSEYFQESVISEEQLKAGKEVVEIQRALVFQTQNLWRNAVGPLLPTIRDLLREFYNWKKANAEVIKQNMTSFIRAGIVAVKAIGEAFRLTIGFIKALKDNWKFFEILFIATMPVVIGATLAWVAANQALVATFIQLQIVGAAVAAELAADWLIAAAPFIAIGAVIAGLFLLFDDLRLYSKTGGKSKTLFGDFINDLEAWEAKLTQGERKPWWLSTLETARDILKEMIRLMEIWEKSSVAGAISSVGAGYGRITGTKQAFDFASQAVQNISRPANASYAPGEGPSLFDSVRQAFSSGPTAAPVIPNFTPAYASPTTQPDPFSFAGVGSSISNSLGSLVFNITGSNPDEIARQVGEQVVKLGLVGHSELEAAQASSSHTDPGP